MSAPGKVILYLLSNDTGVQTSAGQHIYAIRGPEKVVPPYAIINKISEVREPAIDMVPGSYPRTARMQVACFGLTAADAKGLADAVRMACDMKSGTINGVQVAAVLWDADSPDGYDFDVNLYHQPVDFFVTYYL